MTLTAASTIDSKGSVVSKLTDEANQPLPAVEVWSKSTVTTTDVYPSLAVIGRLDARQNKARDRSALLRRFRNYAQYDSDDTTTKKEDTTEDKEAGRTKKKKMQAARAVEHGLINANRPTKKKVLTAWETVELELKPGARYRFMVQVCPKGEEWLRSWLSDVGCRNLTSIENSMKTLRAWHWKKPLPLVRC